MDVVNALWMAFLPLAILTFVIAYYSYKNGVISIHDEKDEWDFDDEDYDLGLNDDDYADDSKGEKKVANNYLHSKWVSFGGGFYGLMALLTFTVIEVKEIIGFVQSIESWDALIALLSIDTLVDVIINSVTNMVAAFTWFFYWPKYIAMDNGWVWLGMAYAGYTVGRWIAKWRLD